MDLAQRVDDDDDDGGDDDDGDGGDDDDEDDDDDWQVVWRPSPTPVTRNLPSLKASALVIPNRLNQPLPSHQNRSNCLKISHPNKIMLSLVYVSNRLIRHKATLGKVAGKKM